MYEIIQDQLSFTDVRNSVVSKECAWMVSKDRSQLCLSLGVYVPVPDRDAVQVSCPLSGVHVHMSGLGAFQVNFPG
uniref:CPSF_A domain-containing protein n=1 Tax=Ascaris lumbricoides TaxID=6252 RepID=A0A0M3HXK8_ASCLU